MDDNSLDFWEEEWMGDPILLTKNQYRKWEEYQLKNFRDFYKNKVVWSAEKVGDKFKVWFNSFPFDQYDSLYKISKGDA